ncbi:hypothetical protein DV738_g2826, partial [Chaetothyriales sp. CBS 135597]
MTMKQREKIDIDIEATIRPPTIIYHLPFCELVQMEAKLDRLRLDPSKGQPSSRAKRAPVDTVAPTELNLRRVDSDAAGTHPPPPTPIPPESGSKYDWSPARVLGGGRPQPLGSARSPQWTEAEPERRRPEKTTAAAGRMIAASLGIKAPKKTEEQRQYDRAVREQEIQRKNREKEAREREQEEEQRAKAAVWDS